RADPQLPGADALPAGRTLAVGLNRLSSCRSALAGAHFSARWSLPADPSAAARASMRGVPTGKPVRGKPRTYGLACLEWPHGPDSDAPAGGPAGRDRGRARAAAARVPQP